jgi:hypothetical protein
MITGKEYVIAIELGSGQSFVLYLAGSVRLTAGSCVLPKQ